MTRLQPPPPPPPPLVTRVSQLCSVLGPSPSSHGSQMLERAKQEVPSLELGPPSPDWIDQLVGSPLGGLKPATRQAWTQLTPEGVVGRSTTVVVQESPQPRHRPAARETSSASRATATTCESRKRTKSLRSQSPSKRDAKRRRAVPAGEKTPIAESEEWGTALTANALSETFLVPSAMDMERDATEEFMNEFWGDLMLDTSPASNDSLLATARPLDELRLPPAPLPAAQPDDRLLEGVTHEQLLELAQFLPGPSEADTAAFDPDLALAELLPPPPAPATAEAPAVAPIDLAALLEQTEIVFSPELAAPVEPASLVRTLVCSPPPPPPPPASAPIAVASAVASAVSAAEPTHYLLVLSAPEQQERTPLAAAPSVTSDVDDDSVDDPEFDDVAEAEVEPASGPARKRAARRAPAATPAEKYRRIRDNNNEASRRSRQQRKLREGDLETRATELETENDRLRQKAEVLEGLLEKVKALMPLLTAKR